MWRQQFRSLERTVNSHLGCQPVPGPVVIESRASVNCEGKRHTMTIDRRGRLRLHDHGPDELRRWAMFMELGGRPCRCYDVLLAWQEYITGASSGALGRIPKGRMRTAAKRMRRVHFLRSCANVLGAEVTNQPGYKRPSGLSLVCGGLLRGRCGVPADIACSVRVVGYGGEYSFQLSRAGKPLFQSVIDRDWVTTVYRRGLALVDVSNDPRVAGRGAAAGGAHRRQFALTLSILDFPDNDAGGGPFFVALCVPRGGHAFARRFANVSKGADGVFVIGTACR
jgi:hypothetical protein